MMKKLVEILAKALVDNPDRVSVNMVEKEKSCIIELRVAPEDMGKVIGKQGRIARGSGTTIQDVNRLIKQFEQTKKMMKQIGDMEKSMKKGGKAGKNPFFSMGRKDLF